MQLMETDRRARAQPTTWSAEFLLYEQPVSGEFGEILRSARTIPEHRVREAVSEAMDWMRQNAALCTPQTLLRVTANGEVHFDAGVTFIQAVCGGAPASDAG
jgi:hypothetical protein